MLLCMLLLGAGTPSSAPASSAGWAKFIPDYKPAATLNATTADEGFQRFIPGHGSVSPANHTAAGNASDYAGRFAHFIPDFVTAHPHGQPKGMSQASGPTQFMPGSNVTGGSSPQSDFTPDWAAQWMPYIPPPMPARSLPAQVNGSWNGSTLNLSYVDVDAFAAGFIGAIAVSPWTADAVLLLNYSGSDVLIQRLWNADVLYPDGTLVGPFDMLTGKSTQTYLVRLKAVSVMSSWGSPPNSLSFMAHGTPQPPEMSVGCGDLPCTFAAAARGCAQAPSVQPLALSSWPGGFMTAVVLEPWVTGAQVELIFPPEAHVTVGHVWQGTLLKADARVFVLQAGNESTAKHGDGLAPPHSIRLLCMGNGGAHLPKVRLLSVPPLLSPPPPSPLPSPALPPPPSPPAAAQAPHLAPSAPTLSQGDTAMPNVPDGELPTAVPARSEGGFGARQFAFLSRTNFAAAPEAKQTAMQPEQGSRLAPTLARLASACALLAVASWATTMWVRRSSQAWVAQDADSELREVMLRPPPAV